MDEELLGRWAELIEVADLAQAPSETFSARTYRPPDQGKRATLSGGSTLSGGQTRDARTGPAAEAPAGPPRPPLERGEEIGEGGMARVYRGEQTRLQREVALKIPKGKDAHGRFREEALVTGLLDHPNIVPVHDLVETDDGVLQLAMKLVRGVSWKDLLHPASEEQRERARGCDERYHLEVLLSVCNAVAFAHNKNLVHNDLKPENIMLGDYGEVLVMDWGTALDVSDLPASGALPARHRSTVRQPFGTPCYMPPELAEGKGDQIDFSTDVYLLGAILHEILTGHPPHTGPNMARVLIQAYESKPPELPDVPTELGDVCRRALARDPAKRYPTVPGLQAALKSYLQHRESAQICDAAQARLDAARASQAPSQSLYAELAEVVAAFRQSLLLWEENADAAAGERAARLTYAETALQNGDLGTAEAQAGLLDSALPATADLRRRIREQQEARAQAARTARRLWQGLAASVVVIILGLSVGFVVVDGLRRTAEDSAKAEKLAKEQEQLAKEDERAAKQLAQAETRRARRAERNARVAEWNANVAKFEVQVEVLWDKLETRTTPQDAARLGAEVGALIGTVSRAPGGDTAPLLARLRRTRNRTENLMLASLTHEPEFLSFPRPLSLPGPNARSLEVAPSGAWVVSGVGHTLASWNLETGRPRAVLVGHADAIRTSAVSADGRWIVSGSFDTTLKVWEADSGRLLRTLSGHADGVLTCAISRDGRRIVSGSRDKTVKVWDTASGRLLQTFAGHPAAVLSCAVSADGRRVASGSFRSLKVWDVASGKLLRSVEGQRGWVDTCALSPDGQWILSSPSEGALTVWNATSGQALRSLALPHEVRVLACAVSPDGRLAAAGSSDNALRVWDAASGRLLHTLRGHSAGVRAVDFCAGDRIVSASRTGDLRVWDLASGRQVRALQPGAAAPTAPPSGSPTRPWTVLPADKTVVVKDTASGKVLRTLAGHTGEVTSCDVSPDGRLIVSASADSTLKVWNAADGRLLSTLKGHNSVVTACAFAPWSYAIVSASEDATIRLWDGVRGRLIHTLRGHTNGVEACAVSPGGRWILSTSRDGTRKVWSFFNARLLRTLDGDPESTIGSDGLSIVAHDGRVWESTGGRWLRDSYQTQSKQCAFNPDGRWIVSGSRDGTVKLWDSRSGRLRRTLAGHTNGVTACAVSPDSLSIVSADKSLNVWEASTGRRVRTLAGHSNRVTACAYSPNGRWIVSASTDKTLKVWDAADGRLLRTLSGHADEVTACAISSDSTWIVSASTDETLKVWDVASGELIRTLSDRGAAKNACAISPDDRWIVSASYDKTLKVWDVASGKVLRTLEGHTEAVTACAYTPNGRWIVSASNDNTLRVWEASSGRLRRTLGGARGPCAISPDGRRIVSASPDGHDGLALWRLHTVDEWRLTDPKALEALRSGRGSANMRLHGRPWDPALAQLPRLKVGK